MTFTISYMSQKFLVTGGAGFIGSNLVERLVEEGNKIIVVDNFHTGNVSNLKHLKNAINIIHTSCSEIPMDIEVDGIFHLGIYSSSPMYKKDPSLVGKVINDFIRIMEIAKRNGCRVVFASTSSLYNGNPIPFREDMEIKVTDYYTEARYAIERLAELYHNLHNVESIGLRLFSVYGEREEFKGKYANLVTQFLWAMRKGEKPVIYGDGTQTRDFIYVGDAVEAFIRAMESDIEFDVFNVGTGKNYNLNELVKMLNDALSTDIEPLYIDNPVKNYVHDTLADTKKARKELEFKSKTTLSEGINIISEYYSNFMKDCENDM